LARARDAAIPTKVVEHTAFPDREQFDRAVHELLGAHRIDLVCLAGYMRLLTPWFVEQWAERMLNIHPALLPSFRGLDTHARALAAGVKIHGATVHFVVPEVDAGPIIAQAAVPVLEDDTRDTLGARVLGVEHKIYPLALDLVARGDVRIIDGRCLIEGRAPSGPMLLVPA
jgi:phosphoribosylglycinamide formyltransferase-1